MSAAPKFARDLTGQRFGRLVVVRRLPSAVVRGKRRGRFELACDCGTAGVVAARDLLARGGVRSCGCLRRDAARERAAGGALTAARKTGAAATVARVLARLHAVAPNGAYLDELAAHCGVGRRHVGQALRTIAAAGVALVRSGHKGSQHVALDVAALRARAA